MQATPRAPYQTPGTPRFAKKPLGASNTIIPKNPKYEAVQAKVNCGPNLARFERSQGPLHARRYGRDEFFVRFRSSDLAPLLDYRMSQAASATTQQEPLQQTATHVLLLDVRDEDAFKSCRLKTASSYPSSRLSRCMYEFTPEIYAAKNRDDTLIVLYDWDGRVSLQVANICFEKGFNNIGVLHGGLLRFVSKFEPAITAAAALTATKGAPKKPVPISASEPQYLEGSDCSDGIVWQTMFSTPASASFASVVSRPSTSASVVSAQISRPNTASSIRPPSRAGLPSSLLTPASTPRMVKGLSYGIM